MHDARRARQVRRLVELVVETEAGLVHRPALRDERRPLGRLLHAQTTVVLEADFVRIAFLNQLEVARVSHQHVRAVVDTLILEHELLLAQVPHPVWLEVGVGSLIALFLEFISVQKMSLI